MFNDQMNAGMRWGDVKVAWAWYFYISPSHVSLVVFMRGRLYCVYYFQFIDKKTKVQSSAEISLSYTKINCKTRNRTQAS